MSKKAETLRAVELSREDRARDRVADAILRGWEQKPDADLVEICADQVEAEDRALLESWHDGFNGLLHLPGGLSGAKIIDAGPPPEPAAAAPPPQGNFAELAWPRGLSPAARKGYRWKLRVRTATATREPGARLFQVAVEHAAGALPPADAVVDEAERAHLGRLWLRDSDGHEDQVYVGWRGSEQGWQIGIWNARGLLLGSLEALRPASTARSELAVEAIKQLPEED